VAIALSSLDNNAVVDELNFIVFVVATVASPFNITNALSLVNGHGDKSIFTLIPDTVPRIVVKELQFINAVAKLVQEEKSTVPKSNVVSYVLYGKHLYIEEHDHTKGILILVILEPLIEKASTQLISLFVLIGDKSTDVKAVHPRKAPPRFDIEAAGSVTYVSPEQL